MIRGMILCAAAMALSTASAARAQSFTYQSQADPPSVTVGATGPDGKPFGGTVLSGTSNGVVSNGTKTKANFKCISMTQPPRDAIFMSHMICDVTSAEGDYTVVFGCNAMGPEENSCVGGLTGKTGTYAGRHGTLTGHSRGSKSTGTGQWYE
jgi:hypothetical protein